ncbi:MAG: 50S ribosomal protein L25/general stress protein Ctc [Acetobacter sp.]|uniref:Large ribosomal subunit protein bL25 n=1 Tax=Acetobacter lovaniensis TaxID=104100 RepID=A0A841QJ83_9PROT|nr:50S ribosomal protein L25/general stress protein Ctc [Acetobacter lovaniensis]MBB6458037.1 large subunit ribosomal protein L25 [Acetobacter lovaniensis]MCI1698563.1 50S ribosomal protein L25/general stress protein Ctc [Acetobacter lovaniensis]MCI1795220.1 50S ribosomal protein L25/general stress protein Ctc [Acetobacter lovaniensis]MCP1239829.1 50S ribosomal protein L25/general stress protein Ctc [Acetobacter lovaniensis]NHN82291.1 50S ribosomal protein L25/general stress protein Ctc [Aceto
MSKITTIQASARAKAGKGAARATRREGLVPGVVYGGKQESTLIALDPRLVVKAIQTSGWRSRVYDIQIEGGKNERALVRDVQLHPVKDSPVHIDFLRLAAGSRVHVEVAVHFVGEDKCPGIKRGGMLNIVRHTVDVEVAAENIPEFFTVDLTKLDINDNVRWDDVQGTEGATPVSHEANFVVASIAAPLVDTSSADGASAS